MATQITKFQDNAGNIFETEAEADASNSALSFAAEVNDFVSKHFPAKPEATKGNPHAGTAKKAILLWLSSTALVDAQLPV